MELDLIANMRKTFKLHQKEEIKEGFSWEQWQKTKLRNLKAYRKRNKDIIKSYSKPIEDTIDNNLNTYYSKGKKLFTKALNWLKSRVNIKAKTEDIRDYGFMEKPTADKDFFGMNDKKLEALQKSVHSDIKKANSSILRKMDDVYRQTIYKSNVYLQSGATTLNKAIDMATKDFLKQGINSIRYADGKSVNIASYAEMCLRTANHRAMLLGEGSKRDEWNIHLVVVSAHANTCKMCEPWQGQVLIDDVFSHPSKEYIDSYKGKYKLVSEAIESGLIHCNCRHSLSTYFEGITQIPKIPNGEEAVKQYEEEQKQRALERKIRKQKRIVAGTCDKSNLDIENKKLRELEKQMRELLKKNPELRRNRDREKVRI